MPNVRVQSIDCFSSEDPNFPASNLLAKEARKWKCRDPGEKSAFVVLRLESALAINGIDVGNEHSAFIEVLVGKSGPTNPEFKEILLTSSFMTPIESRNSTSTNRVRCFTQNSLIEAVAKEKWDLVKVICTQPFNNRVQYGLAFITLHSPNAERKEKSLVPEKFQKQINVEAAVKQETPKVLQLGRFTIREESPDSDGANTSASTLFARWKESRTGQPATTSISTAAAIRNASTPTAIKKTQSQAQPKKPVAITPKTKPCRFDDDDNEEITKPINRNRVSLLYDKDDEKPNEKLEKKLAEDRARQQKEKYAKNEKERKEQAMSEKKEKLHDTSASKFKNFLFDDPSQSKPKETNSSAKPVVRQSSASPPANSSFGSQQSSAGKHERKKHESNDRHRKTSDREQKSSPEREQKKRPSESPSLKDVTKTERQNTSATKRPKLNPENDDRERVKHTRNRAPKYKSFNKLLENVVLVISGIQNPDRANLRNQALAMGAKYKSDWDSSCTHLICAFKNTPKYNQVHGQGKIVKKEWIERSYTLRKRLSWRKYALDTDEAQQTDSEPEIIDIAKKPDDHKDRHEEDTESTSRKQLLPDKAQETDEEALAHYDLDDVVMVEDEKVETVDVSGSDTEEEIERVKQKRKEQLVEPNGMYDKSTDDEGQGNGADGLTPLEFFKGKIFLLDEDLGAVDMIKLERYVELYKGEVTKDTEQAHYVVTRNKKTMADSFKGELIKPLWIYECHDMECLIPSQRYRH